MHHRARTSLLVLAAGALIAIAAGSGATAASLITGAQIKDGTVKSVDVGDGSLTGTDIRNGTVRSADVAGGYYTKAQVDQKFRTSGQINISGAAFVDPQGTDTINVTGGNCVSNATSIGSELVADVPLPTGATVTGLVGFFFDASTTHSAQVQLVKVTSGVQPLAAVSTTPAGTHGPQDFQTALAVPELVDPGEYFHLRFTSGTGTLGQLQVCGAAVQYTVGPGAMSVLSHEDAADAPGGNPTGR
jgi:hypothetical protein